LVNNSKLVDLCDDHPFLPIRLVAMIAVFVFDIRKSVSVTRTMTYQKLALSSMNDIDTLIPSLEHFLLPRELYLMMPSPDNPSPAMLRTFCSIYKLHHPD
jgi:hypothetical protein